MNTFIIILLIICSIITICFSIYSITRMNSHTVNSHTDDSKPYNIFLQTNLGADGTNCLKNNTSACAQVVDNYAKGSRFYK